MEIIINGNATINTTEVNTATDADRNLENKDVQDTLAEFSKEPRQPIDRTNEVLIDNKTSYNDLLKILSKHTDAVTAANEEMAGRALAKKEAKLRRIYGEDYDRLVSEEEKEKFRRAKHRPGAKQLRAYEPRIAKMEIGSDAVCEVFSNGYAIYDNGDRKTVLWVPGCGNTTYFFTLLKDSEKKPWTEKDENGLEHEVRMMETSCIGEDVLGPSAWYHALRIAGENSIEKNLEHPISKGTRSDFNDLMEWELEEKNFWSCGSHFESPEDAYIKKEEREEKQMKVRKGVSELKDTQREAIELCYFNGLTQQETAEKLGKSQSAVSQRLKTGKTALEEKFKKLF